MLKCFNSPDKSVAKGHIFGQNFQEVPGAPGRRRVGAPISIHRRHIVPWWRWGVGGGFFYPTRLQTLPRLLVATDFSGKSSTRVDVRPAWGPNVDPPTGFGGTTDDSFRKTFVIGGYMLK